jgi:hypothetical protein
MPRLVTADQLLVLASWYLAARMPLVTAFYVRKAAAELAWPPAAARA